MSRSKRNAALQASIMTFFFLTHFSCPLILLVFNDKLLPKSFSLPYGSNSFHSSLTDTN